MHVLPRIAESDPASGYLTESLMAAIAQGSDEAKARLKDFLEKRAQEGAARAEAWLKLCATANPPRRRCGRCGSARARSSSTAGPTARSILRSPHAARRAIPTRSRSGSSIGRRPRPSACFLRSASADGAWRTVSYAQALAQVRAIAQALLRRELSAERPIAILSGNDIEHALLGLAAMLIGIPYAPISVPYSLMSSDFGKLKSIIDGPDAGPGVRCRRQAVRERHRGGGAGRRRSRGHAPIRRQAGQPRCSPSLLQSNATDAVDAAHAKVGPDTIAKILFTSGSTGYPKGVINTQRMLCANQAMIRAGLAFCRDEPPVIVDWLPWNHTFGSNHNFDLVLYNGGSLYIDEGKPLPGAIAATARNLKEIAPTIYFNVPKGFEALLPHLRADAALRQNFFSRLKVLFYAGAALAAIRLGRAAGDERRDHRRAHASSSPASARPRPRRSRSPATGTIRRPGNIGLPAPGMDLKLVPQRGQARSAACKGPNITPGYWRRPDLTARRVRRRGLLQDRRRA